MSCWPSQLGRWHKNLQQRRAALGESPLQAVSDVACECEEGECAADCECQGHSSKEEAASHAAAGEEWLPAGARGGVVYECHDACACDETQCKNRRLSK